LNAEGLYKSSFRTQKLSAELLRFYLSFLTGRQYLSLELSQECAGTYSRARWDYLGIAPARLYGVPIHGAVNFSRKFELADFDCC
jgi:hypothetical protein